MPKKESFVDIELDTFNSNNKEISQEENEAQSKVTAWQKQKQTQASNPNLNLNHSNKFPPPPQQPLANIETNISSAYNIDTNSFLFKILVVGDISETEGISAKTFIDRCLNDIFSDNMSIKVSDTLKRALKKPDLKSCQLRWQFFDITTLEGHKRNAAKKNTKNPHAVIIICDPSAQNFEHSIEKWNSYINANNQPLQKMLIGLTTDNNSRQLTALKLIAEKTIGQDCQTHIVNLNCEGSTCEPLEMLIDALAIPKKRQPQVEQEGNKNSCRLM